MLSQSQIFLLLQSHLVSPDLSSGARTIVCLRELPDFFPSVKYLTEEILSRQAEMRRDESVGWPHSTNTHQLCGIHLSDQSLLETIHNRERIQLDVLGVEKMCMIVMTEC